MTDKIVLNDLATFDNSIINSVNANNAALRTVMDNTLSRDGAAPNQMMNNLDMNSNAIYNLPAPVSSTSAARLQDVVGNAIALTIPPVGTSGATVPLLNGSNTFSGTNVFSNSISLTNTVSISNALTLQAGSSVTYPASNAGILTADGSVFSIQNTSKTAHSIYSLPLPSNYYIYDTVRSVLDIKSGSGIFGANAYGAYVFANVPFGSGATANPAVGYFADCTVNVNGANTWGASLASWDGGNSNSSLVGLELDFTSSGTNTTVEGIGIILQGSTQPAASNAIQIESSNAGGIYPQFANAFVVGNNTASVGAIWGSSGPSGTNVSSIPTNYTVYDSTGAGHYLKLYGIPFGGASTALYVQDNVNANGLVFQTNATGNPPSIIAAGSDPNINLDLYSKGNASIRMNSSLIVCTAQTTSAGGSFPALSIIGTTLGLYWGSGAPTCSGAQGSLYMRTDGSSTSTRLYVNTNGSTGWTNVTTAA